MQISFHPKAKKVLIILGAIAVLGIAIFAAWPSLHKPPFTPAIGSFSDTQAAVDAVTAFYTLDYTANPDLWATRVCTLATETGCRAIHAFFGPSVQAMVQENKVQTGCSVVPVRLVSDNGHLRIWQVNVTITDPWPGLEKPIQDAFVEVEKVDGMHRNRWSTSIGITGRHAPEYAINRMAYRGFYEPESNMARPN